MMSFLIASSIVMASTENKKVLALWRVEEIHLNHVDQNLNFILQLTKSGSAMCKYEVSSLKLDRAKSYLEINRSKKEYSVVYEEDGVIDLTLSKSVCMNSNGDDAAVLNMSVNANSQTHASLPSLKFGRYLLVINKISLGFITFYLDTNDSGMEEYKVKFEKLEQNN